MWEISNSFQAISFLYSIILGIGFCLIYDVLRAFRKQTTPSFFEVLIEDLIYFIFAALITFIFLMSVSNGELRGYVIIGITIGFTVCFFTLSRIWIIALTFIFKILKKFWDIIIKYLNGFFDFSLKKLRLCIKVLQKMAINNKKSFKKDLKKQQ